MTLRNMCRRQNKCYGYDGSLIVVNWSEMGSVSIEYL